MSDLPQAFYANRPGDKLGPKYRKPSGSTDWSVEREVEVARFEAEPESDGQACVLYESRAPARFYRLQVVAGQNSVGDPKDAYEVTTGSGNEMGRLLYQLGEQIAGGMIGFDPDRGAEHSSFLRARLQLDHVKESLLNHACDVHDCSCCGLVDELLDYLKERGR